jgi:hypothetical protein
VICSPKHADDDPWGGFPAVRPQVVGGRFSFDGIRDAAQAVYREMLRRNTEGARDAAWLTLVLDDYGILIGKVPELSAWVLDLVALGRSVRVRVVLLSTETNVKAWGWEGRSEARTSCLFVECEEDTRRAVMFRWGKERQAIDTRHVYALAQRARLDGRAWLTPVAGPALNHPVSIVSVPSEAPLRRTLDRPVGYAVAPVEQYDEPVRHRQIPADAASSAVDELVRRTGTASANGALPNTEATEPDIVSLNDDTLIAELVRRDKSANQIAELLGGTRSKVLEKVRAERERQGKL